MGELHHLHLQPHLLHPHLLQALQVLDVDLLNGRAIITVMMKTTMQIVNMMVEIVVETMSTPNTALHVNVWIPMNNLLKLLLKLPLKLQLNLHKMLVDLPNGLVMIIVMMKTTMKHVAGMVEIVVVILTNNIAPYVNVWIPSMKEEIVGIFGQLRSVKREKRKENVT